jgi:hypothetical protein
MSRAPRFVVRELAGYTIRPGAGSVKLKASDPVGLTVWVADEAYYGREVRVWRSEDYGAMWHVFKRRQMRDEAKALAEALNADEGR